MPLTAPSLTLGIEEEYLLVDPLSRNLVAEPPKGFMEECQRRLGQRVTHELLQAQVEVETSVCETVADARRELIDLRGSVAEVAGRFDMALVAASTHPFADWRAQRRVEKERYDTLTRDLQTLARRMVICGMHVHAGVEDEQLRIELMDQATYFLPHLLALSTSSPFWMGQPTGLRAYRPSVFGNLPRSGLPERFDSAEQWHDMLEQLARTGLCDDATKIWWDIRPSARFPTLEMRICDICTRLDDTISIAALYQAILATLYRLRARNQTWRRYRTILIEENKWLAQRHGIQGEFADFGALRRKAFADLMEELIVLVAAEADELGCLAEVQNVRQILQRGTSADRQIQVFEDAVANGIEEKDALEVVVDWLISETTIGVTH